MSSGNKVPKLLFVGESLDLAFISKGQLTDMIFLLTVWALSLIGTGGQHGTGGKPRDLIHRGEPGPESLGDRLAMGSTGLDLGHGSNRAWFNLN